MSTQEDIQIAKMVLIGWRFEPIPGPDGQPREYIGVSPNGNPIIRRSTRYNAAMAAETFMQEYHGLPR